MTTDNLKLMVSAWKARNALYEELFGQYSYSLPKRHLPPSPPEPGSGSAGGSDQQGFSFSSSMSAQRITVLAYAPTENRPYWMYITCGLSNPWFKETPDDVSGFGCELIVKSRNNGRWPIKLLRRMCYYILSFTGTLSPGVIVNMATPLASHQAGELNNMFVWYADEAPDCLYHLPSGAFGIFCAVGITEDECTFAESVNDYGCWAIQQVLRQMGHGQLTNPDRRSVMQSENINSVLQSVRSYADNFRVIQ
jgi:hypothetical protein